MQENQEPAPLNVVELCNSVSGSGLRAIKEFEDGDTVTDFLKEHVGGDQDSYKVRVSGLSPTPEQKLKPNDRISVTPTKIEGYGS